MDSGEAEYMKQNTLRLFGHAIRRNGADFVECMKARLWKMVSWEKTYRMEAEEYWRELTDKGVNLWRG